jgi:hypothetical protein
MFVFTISANAQFEFNFDKLSEKAKILKENFPSKYSYIQEKQ